MRIVAQSEMVEEAGKATPSVDLDALRAAIVKATDAGVGATDVNAAETVHYKVTQARTDAVVALGDASGRTMREYSPDEAEAAIEQAQGVGVEEATIRDATQKLKRVNGQRGEATDGLNSALAPKPSNMNLNALLIAIETAEEAGCDAGTVASAQSTHDSLASRRAAALAELVRFRGLDDPAVGQRDFVAAVTEAQEAGVEHGPTQEAALRLDKLTGGRNHAAVKLQASSRARAARTNLERSIKAATRLQAMMRRARVQEIMNEAIIALRMLRAGNIFMKFSHNGPAHDRVVWLEPIERVDETSGKTLVEETLRWADPEKKRKGALKGEVCASPIKELQTFARAGRTAKPLTRWPRLGTLSTYSYMYMLLAWRLGSQEAMMHLRDITAMSEGVKSEVGALLTSRDATRHAVPSPPLPPHSVGAT